MRNEVGATLWRRREKLYVTPRPLSCPIGFRAWHGMLEWARA